MLPVLDYRQHASGKDCGQFAYELGKACRGDGIFLLSEHGVPRGLLREVLSASEMFFALPKADKSKLSLKDAHFTRGWADEGVEVIGGPAGAPPRKESFSIGFELPAQDPRLVSEGPLWGPNLWPDCDEFRNTMRDYYKELLALGRGIMHAVERDLDLPYGFFQPHFSEPMATLRLSHFAEPVAPPDKIPCVARARAKCDFGALTFVWVEEAQGLQYQSRDGHWQDVALVPGTLLVMVGDVLARWTNEQYRSVPHRILPMAKIGDLAAFYLDPNPDSLITALPRMGESRHPPVRASDHLWTRLQDVYQPKA